MSKCVYGAVKLAAIPINYVLDLDRDKNVLRMALSHCPNRLQWYLLFT